MGRPNYSMALCRSSIPMRNFLAFCIYGATNRNAALRNKLMKRAYGILSEYRCMEDRAHDAYQETAQCAQMFICRVTVLDRRH